MTGQKLTAMAGSGALFPNQANAISFNVQQLANLDNREVLAFTVTALIYELQAKGGTDYRTNHPQLRTDVTTLFGAFNTLDSPLGSTLYAQIEAVIAWNVGQSGTTLGSDVEAIILAMKGERETPESVLSHYILFLRYKLSILGH